MLDDPPESIMPKAPPRRCSMPGCPNHAPCPDHAPAPWEQSNRKAELPPDWPRVRARVLSRDHHRCRFCGRPATEVDHIGDPLDHTIENLRSLCHPCHVSRTARQAVEARARRRGG